MHGSMDAQGSGVSMPTNVLAAIERRRAAERQEVQHLRTLALIPIIVCLFSIMLTFKSQVFEIAIIEIETTLQPAPFVSTPVSGTVDHPQ
jgi:hypothetical protein